MSATGFLDACGFIPASAGAGNFVVATAITGYQTPAAAGATDGTIYAYRAQSADLTQWEAGYGTYTAATATLARTTITANSAGGTVAISFAAAPSVFITALSADLGNQSRLTTGTLPSIGGGQIAGLRNRVINGSFDVWQMGTVFVNPGHLGKLADRWNYDWNGTIGTITFQQQLIQPTMLAAGYAPTYCMAINQSAAGSGNSFQAMSTQIENVCTLAGQTVTISFWAAAPTGACPIYIVTEQFFGSGGSASVFNTSGTINVGPTFKRYSVTFDMASVAGKSFGSNGDSTLNICIDFPINQIFQLWITGVQIEPGNVATPFEVLPQAVVMEQCQRYLQTSYDNFVAPGTVTGFGAVAFTLPAATSVYTIPMKTPMRTEPQVTLYNPSTGAAGKWNNLGTLVPAAVNTNGTKNVSITVTGTAGTTVNGHYVFQDPYF